MYNYFVFTITSDQGKSRSIEEAFETFEKSFSKNNELFCKNLMLLCHLFQRELLIRETNIMFTPPPVTKETRRGRTVEEPKQKQ